MVILLVNAKIKEITLPQYFPIFDGSYSDFTVEWYRVVGSTITLTMMIQICTPHLSGFFKWFWHGMLRCCDRGCTTNIHKTKNMLQEDYEGRYMGAEFLIEVRYSQIISNFFILLLYSSGMPILYIIGML